MNRTNSLTRGGIYAALTVLLVYISSIAPTSKLTILTLASAIIPLSILTTNIKNTIVVYIASTLISFLVGARGMAIAYVLFFGLYPIEKYCIERIRKAPIEIVLKLICFNISIFTTYSLSKIIFADLLSKNFPIYLIIIALQIAFLIYDFALTAMINYINNRLV